MFTFLILSIKIDWRWPCSIKKNTLHTEHTRYVNLVLYVAVSIFRYTRFFIRYGYFKVLSRDYAIILTFCNTLFTIRHKFGKKYVKAFLHAWDFGQSWKDKCFLFDIVFIYHIVQSLPMLMLTYGFCLRCLGARWRTNFSAFWQPWSRDRNRLQ